ncbi:MAG: ribosome-associated translation inhibitor RaiA [Desulfobacteraceae bacterium]|nr:MAG: ribosome-associated translation inhibitor RaiA [Desulfobacteraceae bacterium]
MQISITFKNMDPSDALKSTVQDKFDKLDKMLDRPADAHIVLSKEKIRYIADINFYCDKLKIHAKEESENMYSAIDILSDKVKSQIRKHKEKVRRHLSGDKQSIKTNPEQFMESENATA